MVSRARPGRRAVLAAAILIGVLIVGVVAFGAGRQAASGGAGAAAALDTAGGTAGVTAAAPAAAPGGTASGAVAADGATADSAAAGSVPAPAPDSAVTQDVPVGTVTRRLARTAQLALDVADPGLVTRQVRTAAVTAGGTVADEESTDTGSHLTLRVPADRLDAATDAIATLGHVTSRQSQTVDATEDVVDLDARVASQRASVDRVRALLAQARSIGDVVAVESELTRREADLDSLTGRLDALRGQVALSTVTVDVEKAIVDVPTAPGGFAAGLAGGWDGLRALGTGAGAVAGFVLPFLPVAAVLLGIAWLVRRLARGRRAGPVAAGGSD